MILHRCRMSGKSITFENHSNLHVAPRRDVKLEASIKQWLGFLMVTIMPDICWDCVFPHPISHEYSNANTPNLCLHGFHSDPTRSCVKPGCCSSSLFAGPVTMMTTKSLWRRAASIWRSSTARLRAGGAFFNHQHDRLEVPYPLLIVIVIFYEPMV